MKYELTDDSELVTRCLTNPAIWRMGSDDSVIGINPDLFFAQKNNNVWLKAGDYGAFIGIPINHISLDVHVALLPDARGKAVEISRGAIEWMFMNTCYLHISASIPEYNKFAIRLAREVGMEFVGINKGAFMKNGKLHNQYLFGIKKEDVCHQ
jgi:RimJ/RimL family protein N-acetyltransferase